MNWYAFWADAIVVLHVAYVGFVVLGELAVLVGVLLRKSWARNPWFRSVHLAAVLIVAVELLLRYPCPLTIWESQLREKAGQTVSQASFVGRLFHWIIFYDSEQLALILDAAVGILVVLTFCVFPPRFRKPKRPGTASEGAFAAERTATTLPCNTPHRPPSAAVPAARTAASNSPPDHKPAGRR
jgi:Protein of Unknown function (DUF2784)